MQQEFTFDGRRFLSARNAALESGLSADYVARLCRRGTVIARRIGHAWYVDEKSLRAYLRAQERAKEHRRRVLARERTLEYRSKDTAIPTPAAALKPSVAPALNAALQRKAQRGLAVLADSQSAPGALHAAVQLPLQTAMAHTPAHIVSPTLELAHRLTALIGAFVIVFGGYCIVKPEAAELAWGSLRGAANTAAAAGVHSVYAMNKLADSTNNVLTKAAEEPTSVIAIADAVYARTSTAIATRFAALWKPQDTFSGTGDMALDDTAVGRGAQVAAAGSLPERTSDTPNNELSAQVTSNPIATSVKFSGNVLAYGDLIAYDTTDGLYTLASESGDTVVYAVAIKDPAILFHPEGGQGLVSVVRSGTVLINVTMENGPIEPGDALTLSSIPGKARRANEGESVIGRAADAFTGENGVSLQAPDGSRVLSGTIPVNFTPSVGPLKKGENCGSLLCLIDTHPELMRAFVRYSLAGLVAALSVILAFRSFLSDANYGVIAIGRNPLARHSIQTMMLLNALVSFIIASAGLFTAFMIIYAAA